MNRLLGYFSLLLVILWLALSYLPSELFAPANLAFPTMLVLPFQWIVVGLVVLFIVIQIFLLYATYRIMRHQRNSFTALSHATTSSPTANSVSPRTLRQLTLSWELWWTIVPLLMTFGLIVIGYRLWLNL